MATDIKRNLESVLSQDLQEKMVFLAGPRQCGKTTLARMLLKPKSNSAEGAYYNWDVDAHRRVIRASKLDESSRLWVLDELHKFPRWRNWLKGMYDLHHSSHSFLVTGSARLDLYSRGGDSLQGRYFFHHLHPFTLSEVLGLKPLSDGEDVPQITRPAPKASKAALDQLLSLGGFPEPFLGASGKRADRWRLSYGQRLIQDDVRSLESLKDLDRLELLYERLPQTVGSILSLNSLREDLEVAFETVRNWCAVFERLYVCFRVAPFGAMRIKAVKKEQKLYLWDWGRVESAPARLENLLAVHLMRLKDWCEDVEGVKTELRYFRNTVGHEVDFVLLRRQKPWMAIELKTGGRDLGRGLKYLLERVKIPYAFQLSLTGTEDYRPADINGCRIRVMPLATFLCNLP